MYCSLLVVMLTCMFALTDHASCRRECMILSSEFEYLSVYLRTVYAESFLETHIVTRQMVLLPASATD